MSNIANKLTRIKNTKENIKEALIEKGVDMEDVIFEEYPEKIELLGEFKDTPKTLIKVRDFNRSDSMLTYEDVNPTLIKLSNGNIQYYENDLFDGMFPFNQMFEVEDIKENRFIEIPPFYVKFIKEDGILTGYDIASYKVDETYYLSPRFINQDTKEIQPLLFGKYIAYVIGGEMTSKSGVTATADRKRSDFRADAYAVGEEYFPIDFHSWQIVRLLMWTYFGTVNSDKFFPDIEYGSYLANGQMDDVGYKVAYNSVTGKNTFFGIENIIKEKFHIIDGVNINHPNIYVCEDFRNFKDDTEVDYELITENLTGESGNFITFMTEENGLIFPKTVSGGSSSTYIADYFYAAFGWSIFLSGSRRTANGSYGLSIWRGDLSSLNSNSNSGSRLMACSLEVARIGEQP